MARSMVDGNCISYCDVCTRPVDARNTVHRLLAALFSLESFMLYYYATTAC
jgi:hypothetical protein